ncbi:MAG: TIGR00730 family Rossman fold protein [Actinomycetota bacterium]|nr:TIGR00730 family Rossman fold protein [Actinomycetota bacterium]
MTDSTQGRPTRLRSGDDVLDRRIDDLLDAAGAHHDRDQLFEILASAVRLAGDDAERLDLKITNSALKEMRRAFRVFAPWRDVPKVTIFGSARTLPDDPLYSQTRDLAAALAGAGWMIVTGAGPGIMAAGTEGAGPDHSLGVNIRLPFEGANAFVGDDTKHVVMKYFFTRKLMLVKESAGFVVMPGGFGTLDEIFELLTLLQTGKAAPAPIVLLDVPGGGYWRAWKQFIATEVVGRSLADTDDLLLCRVTDDVNTAVGEILGFYRNYHSIRWVGNRLVVRLRATPAADEIVALNVAFADICAQGGIAVTAPLPAEMADHDHLELSRLVLEFDRTRYGRLRGLIDALNALPSAPPG